MFRKQRAQVQPDALLEHIAGVRSSLEAALSQMDQLSKPPRRGPLGMRDPFGRRSYVDELKANLGSISTGMVMDSLSAATSTRRGPELSGLLRAGAVAFAAAGAALLWLGTPTKAISSASEAMRRFTGGESMHAEPYIASGIR